MHCKHQAACWQNTETISPARWWEADESGLFCRHRTCCLPDSWNPHQTKSWEGAMIQKVATNERYQGVALTQPPDFH